MKSNNSVQQVTKNHMGFKFSLLPRCEIRIIATDMTDQEISALYRLISTRMRLARKQAGKSQQALGTAVNVDRTSIVHIEGGRQRPPLHLIWQIAEALQLRPLDLIPTPDEVAREAGKKIDVNEAMIAKIEEAAGEDPTVRGRLARFIDEALSSKPSEE